MLYEVITIFARLQRLGIPFFDRNPVGRLMTRVTSDVEVLNELFSSGVVTVFGDVFTLVLIVIAMVVMDWRLALVRITSYNVCYTKLLRSSSPAPTATVGAAATT